MQTRQRRQICLAQNFLRSPELVRRLVSISKIGRDDIVYDIGAGDGIITAVLANIARQVIAIEKDPALVRRLRERFRPLGNVEIVERDFLAYTFRNRRSEGSDYKIFANIPFNLTAQLVRKI